MTYDMEYLNNIDKHPFTGDIAVSFDARISTANWLDGFFNGSEKYEQVTGVTRNKTYHIHKITGYGDAVDMHFINDNGEEASLGNYFFVDPDNKNKPVPKKNCYGCAHNHRKEGIPLRCLGCKREYPGQEAESHKPDLFEWP